MAASIDIKELKRLLTSGNATTLLDVRRKEDYEASPKKIPGATWHDPNKIEEWVADLPHGAPTVVYCVKGGAVSQSVAERLQQEGREAAFLEGGIKAWIEQGEPVSR
jgi:rhodanese-related sulfurtransferase